jgi:hypothetical protein
VADPLSVGIALVAAVLGVVLAWLQWPRPVALDGERWFKTFLVTLLRGELESDGFEAWDHAVRSWVPYHPAGRFPERKVMNPLGATLPGALLAGERSLLEALHECASPQERWVRMFDDDEGARATLMDDPVELGHAYNPSTYVGADKGWEAVARWGRSEGDFFDRLLRRLDAHWFFVGPTQGEARSIPSLAALLGERGTRIDLSGEALIQHLENALPNVSDRCVLVGEGAGIVHILNALRDRAMLRDQVVAVVSIGGIIGGLEGETGVLGTMAREDWLEAWFKHRHLDSEVVRQTPYMALQWLDRAQWPPGAAGLAIANARFPPVPEEPIETIEVVDLGVLPADDRLPNRQVARALVAVVSCWVLSRR